MAQSNIIANISWNSLLWKGQSSDPSGFRFVRDGGWPNETFNFDFDCDRNKGDFLHGFFMCPNSPVSFREDGVVVFASRNPERVRMEVVGIYGRTTLSRDYEFPDSTNLKALKSYATFFDSYADFPLDDNEKYLDGKLRIGQANFNYIGDECTQNIIYRALDIHWQHPQVRRTLRRVLEYHYPANWCDESSRLR